MKVLCALILLVALFTPTKASEKVFCDSPGERFAEILWYRCEPDNSTTIVGCIAETGEKAKLGEYITTETFVHKCERKDDRYVNLKPVKCIIEGNELRPRETVAVGDFFYECNKLKSMLYLSISGCVSEEGRLVKFGDDYRKGDFKYNCFLKGNEAYELPIACIVDDTEVKIGKTHIRDSIYFRCVRDDTTKEVQLVAEGCVDSKKKRRRIGSTFSDGKFQFNCTKKNTKDGSELYMEIVSCYDTDDENVEKVRNFGESWYRRHPTNGKFKYKVICSGDKNMAAIEPTKCATDRRGKLLEIDIGCGTPYDKSSVFICEKDEEGDVQMELRTVDNSDTFESIYKKYGVRQC